jgi:uncharacterized protein
MPLPPAADPADVVDAAALAHAGSSVERRLVVGALTRLQEAGVTDAAIVARLGFSEFEFSSADGFSAVSESSVVKKRPAIDGTIQGQMHLRCQRCLQPVEVAFDESFAVLLVNEERADEPGGYEPIVTNAARLDVRWLIEEQVLLAIPLVPMHATGACAKRVDGTAQVARDEQVAEGRQKPFENLRNMLRER